MSEKKSSPLSPRPTEKIGVLASANAHEEYPLSAIEDAVRSIRFGTVQIVIQDGRIVQIEKTEKIRLR